MPPWAAWKKPSRSLSAPVKAPFRAPKNSLSMRFSGIAPQLTATKGAVERGPSSWIIRAARSLPLPDSPEMNTGAWLRESFSIRERTCTMACDSPIRLEVSFRLASSSLPRTENTDLTRARSCSMETGLDR